ncbi:MAG: hypothetical protein FWF50_06535 [Defluviitaleaceae bacterium]|nr:hypothetical protein [Defluviitaleaceae bacterium]
MTYIKNIFKLTKKEIFYQKYSKNIFFVTMLLIFFAGTHLFSLYMNVLHRYNMYTQNELSHIEQGLDILEHLSIPHVIHDGLGTGITIENTLHFDFVQLSIALQNISPRNIISGFLEYIIFVICAIIFGIYASYIGTFDYKSKTHKFFSVSNSQWEIAISKILSLIFVMVLTILISILFVFASSFLLREIIIERYNLERFIINMLNYDNSLFIQIIFSFSIIIFYMVICFFISFVTKNMIFSTIFIIFFVAVIPFLGAYDPRNVIAYFSHHIFNFESRFVMNNAIPIDVTKGIMSILATVFLTILVSNIIIKNRNNYI